MSAACSGEGFEATVCLETMIRDDERRTNLAEASSAGLKLQRIGA